MRWPARALCTVAKPMTSTVTELLPSTLKFVPPHQDVTMEEIAKLQDFILTKKRLLLITGAGISTESGIPDYRGEGVGLYATSKRKPMQYQDFIQSQASRRRYWARNFVGWPAFSTLMPNPTHQFLANLENQHPNIFVWLITQNVDALHVKAGSRKVTELHGSAFQVGCLSCGDMVPREVYQKQMEELNPSFRVFSSVIRPDSDVDITDEQVKMFEVPHCQKCGTGTMKPYVVFFGENVPSHRVEFLFKRVDECDGVAVFGSSLQVYSGYRFVKKASEQSKPICIVNIGATRADHLATLRISNVRCADILSQVNT